MSPSMNRWLKLRSVVTSVADMESKIQIVRTGLNRVVLVVSRSSQASGGRESPDFSIVVLSGH